MKMHVILGWNRHAISSGGAVAPIPQHGDHTFIHSMPKPLEQSLRYDSTLRIDGNFHDHVALKAAGKLCSGNPEVLEGNRQSGLDFVSAAEAVVCRTLF